MRVVNTGIENSASCTRSLPASPVISPFTPRNSTSHPSLRPIQLRCIDLMRSGQSTESIPERSRSAYFVMRKNHCSSSFCTTTVLQRSHAPSTTCSLASTVLHPSHQFTGAFARYARSFL